VPIVSGNVSLYNEGNGVAIKPSPIVGMVGLIEDRSKIPASGFVTEGDVVFLVGGFGAEMQCSEYLALALGRTDDLGPPPSLDLDAERAAQLLVRGAARAGLLRSAHDCSEGGLAVALAESCIEGSLGFRAADGVLGALLAAAATGEQPSRADAALFGEGQSRFIVSCRPEDAADLAGRASEMAVPLLRLGIVAGDRLELTDALSLSLMEMDDAWNTPF
jgi:phosphoribosylformylglycinamidine synthase